MSRGQVSLVVLGIIAVFVIAIVSTVIGYNNRAVMLENRFKVTYQKVTGVHDNIKRIVEAKAGVATAYKKGLIEAIEAQIQGRKGGDIVKAMQEAAPGLDVSIYRDVANAVEGQRTGFLNAQVELLAVKQEHDNLRMQFPSSIICGSRAELVYNVITSENTQKVFSSGKDESESNPFAK